MHFHGANSCPNNLSQMKPVIIGIPHFFFRSLYYTEFPQYCQYVLKFNFRRRSRTLAFALLLLYSNLSESKSDYLYKMKNGGKT